MIRWFVLVVLATGMTGCVSMGTYERHARAWEEERQRLEAQIAALSADPSAEEESVSESTEGVSRVPQPLTAEPATVSISTSVSAHFQPVAAQLNAQFRKEMKRGEIKVREIDGKILQIVFNGDQLFTGTRVDLNGRGQRTIDDVAEVARSVTDHLIQIEAFPLGREASRLRAGAVHQRLQNVNGLDSKLLRVKAGAGSSAETSRRIEISFVPLVPRNPAIPRVGEIDPREGTEAEMKEEVARQQAALQGTRVAEEKLSSALEKDIAAQTVVVDVAGPDVALFIQESRLGVPGQDRMTEEGLHLLERVSGVIKTIKNFDVSVFGHPAASVRSSIRAAEVVRVLKKAGIAVMSAIERPAEQPDRGPQIEIRLSPQGD